MGIPTVLRRFLLSAVLGFLSFSGSAYASCQGDKGKADPAIKQSKAAAQGAKANEMAATSSAGAQAGQAINPNSGLGAGAAASCGNGYGAALPQIESAMAQCQSMKCQQSDQQDAAYCDECNSNRQRCLKEVGSDQAVTNQAKAACDQYNKDANNTKDQSEGGKGQGGMPQMPQMPQGGGEETPEQPEPYRPPVVAGGVDCTKPDAYLNSECNDKLAKDCSANSGGANCQTFFKRYCTTASDPNAQGNLSAARSGEGIGSEYCKQSTTKAFCEVEGRNACPSCKNQQMQSSPACANGACMKESTDKQLAEAQASCPTDPMFMDPAIAARAAAGAAAITGSPSTGGGSSVASNQPGTPAADSVEKERGPKMDMSTDGGGGGFSGYGGSSSGSSSDDFKFNFGGFGGGKKPASVGAAGGVGTGALAKDIPGKSDNSVFKMFRDAIEKRCQRKALHHCGPQ